MFDYAPVALWEIDASGLQVWLEGLRHRGVRDLRVYLQEHSAAISYGLSRLGYVRCNRSAVQLFAAESESRLLQNIPAVLSYVPPSVIVDVLVSRWEDRRFFAAEIELCALDGRQISELVTIATPTQSGLPDLRHVVVVFNDITERRRAENALRESEQRLRLLIQASGTGWWHWNFATQSLTMDDQCKALFGLPLSSDTDSRSLRRYLEPRNRERLEAMLLAARAKPGDYGTECCVAKPDGSRRWLSLRGHAFSDGKATPAHVMGVAIDITEHKETENALREREELLRLAEEAGNSGSFDIDLRRGVARVSQGILTIYGAPQDEDLQLDTWKNYVVPEDWQKIESVAAAFSPARPAWRCEFRIRRPDGQTRWIESRGRTIFNEKNEPTHAIGVNLDITARKRSEEALRESEQFYRTLIETLPVGVVLADPQGRVTYISPWAREAFRVPADKGLGTSPLDWIAPEHHPVVRERMRRVLVERIPQPAIEYRMLRTDGVSVWAELSSAPFFDDNGGVKGVITVCQDVTARKRAEDDLRARETLLRAIADNLPQAMVYQIRVNEVGRREFTYVSGNVAQLHEVAPQEVLQNPELLHQQIVPESLPGFLAAERQAFEESQVFHYEAQCRLPSGRMRWIELVSAPRSLADGTTVWDGLEFDITERKRGEEFLRGAKAAAEAASQAKSEFLANMSHEIRTPMNAVLGMTELALTEELSDSVRDYLRTARDAAGNLLELLDDILDFSRIEAGRLQLQPKKFSVRAAVDEVLKTLGLRAYQKGLELVGEVSPATPDRWAGDALRLRQVLLNLVGNAIKFTNHGEVVVRAKACQDDPGRLEFSVADTGIGISSADQKKIFSPFTQADTSSTRSFGGTGLGLAISSRLVEMMGGRISLESESGRGSVFRFSIAVERLGDEEGNRISRYDGRSVLVVDSNATSRNRLYDVFSGWGLEVEMVAQHEDAALRLESVARLNRRFDLIVIDSKIIAAVGKSLLDSCDQHGPVVVAVSPALRSESAKFLSQRRVWLVEKPLCYGDLARTVAQLFEERSSVEGTSGGVRGIWEEKADRPLRILLVEDNKANQKLAEYVLSHRGHAIQVADNGRVALEMLQQDTFDAVLMDVQMPEMDGYQATAAIRQLTDREKSELPIIAMTAHATKGDEDRCFGAGMDAYIRKPVSANGLVETVERLASAKRGARAPMC